MEKGVQAWTGNTTVHTKYGTVKGFEDLSCTWACKAISFATPPPVTCTGRQHKTLLYNSPQLPHGGHYQL